MPDLPDLLRLTAILPAQTAPKAIFSAAVAHFAANPLSGVTEWMCTRHLMESGKPGKSAIKGVPTEADYDRIGAAAFEDGFSMEGDHIALIVKPLRNGSRGKPSETFGIDAGWSLFVGCDRLNKVKEADFRSMLTLLTGFLTELAQALPPLRAEIRRDSDSFIGPVPPLAEPEVVMACLPTDLVPADYANPDGFWSAWDRVDYLGHGLALVQRAAEVVDEPAFKAVALRSGLAMGRAAKPGKTSYFLPEPTEAEAAVLEDGESCLEQLGYNATDRSLEFTAMLEAGSHLPARDLFLLVAYLENGTGGGDPVEMVIVTFPTRPMAEAEARPLLDIGARVQYLSDNGEWVVLAD